MTKFAFERTFATRESSAIGAATIGTVKVEGEATIKINGTAVPGASVDYLMTFALQSLQDAYAGADDVIDAQKRFSDKLDRLLAGTIGTRTGVDPSTSIAREIMTAKYRAAGKELPKKADERNAMLDASIAKNKDTMDKLVAAEVERRRKAREAVAEVDVTL